MNCFDDRTGHITDEGFAALTGGTAGETERLEMAEHLSFCDLCCSRYARLLADDRLVLPPDSLPEPAQLRARDRERSIFFRRLIRAGTAACLALTLWYTGAFRALVSFSPQSVFPPAPPATAQEQMQQYDRQFETDKEAYERALRAGRQKDAPADRFGSFFSSLFK